jgi:H+/Cl- antiporter ClcA
MRIQRLVAVGLIVLAAVSARATFDPPQKGPFSDPDSNAIHWWAGNLGVILGLVPVGGACGALVLPLDIYQEIRHPETKWGDRFSNPICLPVAAAGYFVTYFAFGFPVYMLKVAFWDVPRRFWWNGPPPAQSEPEGAPYHRPERLPAGALEPK